MKLYHYAKEYHDELKTLEMQREITVDDISKYQAYKTPLSPDKPYWKHISFFFDRVPIDKMGGWYGKDHHTWYSGNILYEYTVDITTFGRFSYDIVETPDKIELLFDESISDQQYYQLMLENIKKKGYRGNSTFELNKASKPFVGQTEKYIQHAVEHSKFETFNRQYAACVPHVMIYPSSGVIKPVFSQTVKIK